MKIEDMILARKNFRKLSETLETLSKQNQNSPEKKCTNELDSLRLSSDIARGRFNLTCFRDNFFLTNAKKQKCFRREVAFDSAMAKALEEADEAIQKCNGPK